MPGRHPVDLDPQGHLRVHQIAQPFERVPPLRLRSGRQLAQLERQAQHALELVEADHVPAAHPS